MHKKINTRTTRASIWNLLLKVTLVIKQSSQKFRTLEGLFYTPVKPASCSCYGSYFAWKPVFSSLYSIEFVKTPVNRGFLARARGAFVTPPIQCDSPSRLLGLALQ